MEQLTPIQEKLMKEYERRGYYRFKRGAVQARGEVLMRKDGKTGFILRTILPSGHTMGTRIRGVRNLP